MAQPITAAVDAADVIKFERWIHSRQYPADCRATVGMYTRQARRLPSPVPQPAPHRAQCGALCGGLCGALLATLGSTRTSSTSR